MRTFRLLGTTPGPVQRGHPWIHADRVREERGAGQADTNGGDVGVLLDAAGRSVGWGLVSDGSALRLRLLAAGAPEQDVDTLLADRVAEAVRLRARLFPRPEHTNAYRLVHAEGDGLPGLVVDRFGSLLVAQFATAPMHRRRAGLADRLLAATGATTLLARAGGYETEEGIPPAEVPFERGETAPESVDVVEAGMPLRLRSEEGQKTGHYADQRENRVLVAEAARGARVLDLYGGTGGFAIQALRHGARHAHLVESSAGSLEMARENAQLSGVAPALELERADVRHVLQRLKTEERTYDVVVADPPNFFPRRGGDGHALKAYRELNVQALTRLAEGGLLATFCCSARLDATAFAELVASAARECRRTMRVLRTLEAGPDHPVRLGMVEGRYLTGLLLARAD